MQVVLHSTRYGALSHFNQQCHGWPNFITPQCKILLKSIECFGVDTDEHRRATNMATQIGAFFELKFAVATSDSVTDK
jgi:hypothetical protein